MKQFKMTKEIEVTCHRENTRYGFRHLATLSINGIARQNGKACYYNRTWEKYEFQSVLRDVVNKAFKNKIISEQQKKDCDEFIKGDHTDWSGLRTIGLVAKLGDVFCENQKASNDWKARMLKAGLSNQGLIMPENWESLSEPEKERRLNGAIQQISTK